VNGIVPALIGLAGVLVGGGITAAMAWWQTVTSQKARLSELELNFHHERALRDEGAKRAALLEVYYFLKNFERESYGLYSEHRHGDGDVPAPVHECGSVDISSVNRRYLQYRNGIDKHTVLFSKELKPGAGESSRSLGRCNSGRREARQASSLPTPPVTAGSGIHAAC
jgi:hypothetical protein